MVSELSCGRWPLHSFGFRRLVAQREVPPVRLGIGPLGTPDVVCCCSGVGGQPGRKVGWALEVEQGHSCGEGFSYGRGFQLIHWQGLDPGGGVVREGAAAAVELARGDTACAAGVGWAAGFRGFTESRLVCRR